MGKAKLPVTRSHSAGSGFSQARRPKRNISTKNYQDDSVGLSRMEERELKKALYASLQESKRLYRCQQQCYETPTSLSNHSQLSQRSSRPMRSRSWPHTPSQNSTATTSTNASVDESSQDSVKSSVSSISDLKNKQERKIHAQRKFAQGSLPPTPSTTPVKVKASPIKLLPKTAKTEDFLTFLCLRGSSVLPPHLDFFNFSRGEPPQGEISAPQTPTPSETNSKPIERTRESTPESSSVSTNDELYDLGTPSPCSNIFINGRNGLSARKAARASAGTPETARGIVSLSQGLNKKSSRVSTPHRGRKYGSVDKTPSPRKGSQLVRGQLSPSKRGFAVKSLSPHFSKTSPTEKKLKLKQNSLLSFLPRKSSTKLGTASGKSASSKQLMLKGTEQVNKLEVGCFRAALRRSTRLQSVSACSSRRSSSSRRCKNMSASHCHSQSVTCTKTVLKSSLNDSVPSVSRTVANHVESVVKAINKTHATASSSHFAGKRNMTTLKRSFNGVKTVKSYPSQGTNLKRMYPKADTTSETSDNATCDIRVRRPQNYKAPKGKSLSKVIDMLWQKNFYQSDSYTPLHLLPAGTEATKAKVSKMLNMKKSSITSPIPARKQNKMKCRNFSLKAVAQSCKYFITSSSNAVEERGSVSKSPMISEGFETLVNPLEKNGFSNVSNEPELPSQKSEVHTSSPKNAQKSPAYAMSKGFQTFLRPQDKSVSSSQQSRPLTLPSCNARALSTSHAFESLLSPQLERVKELACFSNLLRKSIDLPCQSLKQKLYDASKSRACSKSQGFSSDGLQNRSNHSAWSHSEAKCVPCPKFQALNVQSCFSPQPFRTHHEETPKNRTKPMSCKREKISHHKFKVPNVPISKGSKAISLHTISPSKRLTSSESSFSGCGFQKVSCSQAMRWKDEAVSGFRASFKPGSYSYSATSDSDSNTIMVTVYPTSKETIASDWSQMVGQPTTNRKSPSSDKSLERENQGPSRFKGLKISPSCKTGGIVDGKNGRSLGQEKGSSLKPSSTFDAVNHNTCRPTAPSQSSNDEQFIEKSCLKKKKKKGENKLSGVLGHSQAPSREQLHIPEGPICPIALNSQLEASFWGNDESVLQQQLKQMRCQFLYEDKKNSEDDDQDGFMDFNSPTLCRRRLHWMDADAQVGGGEERIGAVHTGPTRGKDLRRTEVGPIQQNQDQVVPNSSTNVPTPKNLQQSVSYSYASASAELSSPDTRLSIEAKDVDITEICFIDDDGCECSVTIYTPKSESDKRESFAGERRSPTIQPFSGHASDRFSYDDKHPLIQKYETETKVTSEHESNVNTVLVDFESLLERNSDQCIGANSNNIKDQRSSLQERHDCYCPEIYPRRGESKELSFEQYMHDLPPELVIKTSCEQEDSAAMTMLISANGQAPHSDKSSMGDEEGPISRSEAVTSDGCYENVKVFENSNLTFEFPMNDKVLGTSSSILAGNEHIGKGSFMIPSTEDTTKININKSSNYLMETDIADNWMYDHRMSLPMDQQMRYKSLDNGNSIGTEVERHSHLHRYLFQGDIGSGCPDDEHKSEIHLNSNNLFGTGETILPIIQTMSGNIPHVKAMEERYCDNVSVPQFSQGIGSSEPDMSSLSFSLNSDFQAKPKPEETYQDMFVSRSRMIQNSLTMTSSFRPEESEILNLRKFRTIESSSLPKSGSDSLQATMQTSKQGSHNQFIPLECILSEDYSLEKPSTQTTKQILAGKITFLKNHTNIKKNMNYPELVELEINIEKAPKSSIDTEQDDNVSRNKKTMTDLFCHSRTLRKVTGSNPNFTDQGPSISEDNESAGESVNVKHTGACFQKFVFTNPESPIKETKVNVYKDEPSVLTQNEQKIGEFNCMAANQIGSTVDQKDSISSDDELGLRSIKFSSDDLDLWQRRKPIKTYQTRRRQSECWRNLTSNDEQSSTDTLLKQREGKNTSSSSLKWNNEQKLTEQKISGSSLVLVKNSKGQQQSDHDLNQRHAFQLPKVEIGKSLGKSKAEVRLSVKLLSELVDKLRGSMSYQKKKRRQKEGVNHPLYQTTNKKVTSRKDSSKVNLNHTGRIITKQFGKKGIGLVNRHQSCISKVRRRVRKPQKMRFDHTYDPYDFVEEESVPEPVVLENFPTFPQKQANAVEVKEPRKEQDHQICSYFSKKTSGENRFTDFDIPSKHGLYMNQPSVLQRCQQSTSSPVVPIKRSNQDRIPAHVPCHQSTPFCGVGQKVSHPLGLVSSPYTIARLFPSPPSVMSCGICKGGQTFKPVNPAKKKPSTTTTKTLKDKLKKKKDSMKQKISTGIKKKAFKNTLKSKTTVKRNKGSVEEHPRKKRLVRRSSVRLKELTKALKAKRTRRRQVQIQKEEEEEEEEEVTITPPPSKPVGKKRNFAPRPISGEVAEMPRAVTEEFDFDIFSDTDDDEVSFGNISSIRKTFGAKKATKSATKKQKGSKKKNGMSTRSSSQKSSVTPARIVANKCLSAVKKLRASKHAKGDQMKLSKIIERRRKLKGDDGKMVPAKRGRRPAAALGPKKASTPEKQHRSDGPTKSDTSSMVDVPTFRPTEEEFRDPIQYIESIREQAEPFGMCQIIPPSSWKCESKINEEMRFTAQVQPVHRLYRRWGPNVQFMSSVNKHLDSIGADLESSPQIGGVEVDLCKLSRTIHEFGGMQKVVDKKKWVKIADAMKIPKMAQDRGMRLYDVYCKYLLPYDTLSFEEKSRVEQSVISERQRREKAGKGEDDDAIVKGKSNPLSTFIRVARNVQSMWFKDDPAPEQVESEYFRLLEERTNHVAVQCGHVSTSTQGSGFPSKKDSPYSRHGWNLNNLTENPKCILRCLGPVSGATIPTLHIGMMFATSCWCTDIHHLPYIQYLHTGSDIVWYSIPKNQESKLKSAMKELVPTLVSDDPRWLKEDTVMVNPAHLTSKGVTVARCIQKAKTFVAIFPKSYTATISCGYNVSESVHYATRRWISNGVAVAEDLVKSAEPELFSMDALLCHLISDPTTDVQTLKTAVPFFEKVLSRELSQRKQLFEAGLKASKRVGLTDEAPSPPSRKRSIDQVEENICDVSKKHCFFSKVINESEHVTLSLEEGLKHIQKKKNLKHCKLNFRYTEDELRSMLQSAQCRLDISGNGDCSSKKRKK